MCHCSCTLHMMSYITFLQTLRHNVCNRGERKWNRSFTRPTYMVWGTNILLWTVWGTRYRLTMLAALTSISFSTCATCDSVTLWPSVTCKGTSWHPLTQHGGAVHHSSIQLGSMNFPVEGDYTDLWRPQNFTIVFQNGLHVVLQPPGVGGYLDQFLLGGRHCYK